MHANSQWPKFVNFSCRENFMLYSNFLSHICTLTILGGNMLLMDAHGNQIKFTETIMSSLERELNFFKIKPIQVIFMFFFFTDYGIKNLQKKV